MARSATLNPSSVPFFPGALRSSEDEGGSGLGFGHYTAREHDSVSTSTPSVSPSEFYSIKSSPSPPRDEHGNGRFQSSPPIGEDSHSSPPLAQGDSYAGPGMRIMREASALSGIDAFFETDKSAPAPFTTEPQAFFGLIQQGREQMETPPVPLPSENQRPSITSTHRAPSSSSPVSSLDSGGQLAGSSEQSLGFEAQLRSSPFIRDILDRLVRCENSSREIQHDLGEVHRKVDILLERSLGPNSLPEFRDPFAPSNGNGHSTSPPLFSPKGSISGPAPNQPVPPDDITQISQRLNTLTSSVGKLLALQTQQHMQTATPGHPGAPVHPTPRHVDLAPNQLISPNQSILGHGLPNRPEMRQSPRVPNPPMRTWSVGNLDLPPRPQDGVGSLGRQLGDKRRSVTSLMRRDSTGLIDPQGDSWPNGSPRDSNPTISKWEQLSLSPDLLRSLSKFGVGPPNKIQQRALPFLLRGSDIIAQAPPTQERIAAYVIPAIQIALNHMVGRPPNRGPIVIMVSTTVDQATQAQRMIRDLGGPIGVRSALGVGTSSVNNDLTPELRLLQQNMPHIICGTPQKLHSLFTSSGGLTGSEVRFLVLDEVDQLIARNLHEFVFNIVKLLPPPRSRSVGTNTPNATPGPTPQAQFGAHDSNPSPNPPFSNTGRRFSALSPPLNPRDAPSGTSQTIERQTALFSNTVPQDVLNLATAIQLKEPVRVLVRRDGNVTHADANQGSRGLRQFYLYLAFTAGGRSDPTSATSGGGLGIIGSGRGSSSAESAQAREWKLEALADLFDDVEVSQAVVHVGGLTALDSVVYKLASKGLEAVPLHGDMNAGTKLAALNKFRNSASVMMRQSATKVLVVYDVQVKPPEVSHIPLIINYDLPKAVEEYAHRVAPAIAPNYSRAGVVVNFVTATGGDVEMLRSIECFYKIKCPEVPMSLRDIV